jgi:hypothetical protein
VRLGLERPRARAHHASADHECDQAVREEPERRFLAKRLRELPITTPARGRFFPPDDSG